MAVTEYVTGTETVSTTEWSMTTDTAGPDTDTGAGCFQACVDLNALLTGDQFQFRIYEKARSADTQRIVYETIWTGAQSQPNFMTPALLLLNGWDMTLKKLAGTDRLITWSIRKA